MLHTFCVFASTDGHRGKEIELTPKEIGLLALFVKRNGCALTRDESLKRVWGYDILVTTRSVDRCINALHNKIEKICKCLSLSKRSATSAIGLNYNAAFS
jgi:DNA-binding response OmpR family regulator